MTNRVVTSVWWLLVMGFVAAAGIGSMYYGYWAVAELLRQRWTSGAIALVAAVVLAGATWLACRHRSDLLYG